MPITREGKCQAAAVRTSIRREEDIADHINIVMYADVKNILTISLLSPLIVVIEEED